MTQLEAAIAKCNTREEKWITLTTSIWGKPQGFPFQLDPKKGEISFLSSKKNEVLINASFVLLGLIKSRKDDFVWVWPWGSSSMRNIRGNNRLDLDTLTEFIDDHEDFKSLSKIIKIKGGQFVFKNGIIDSRLKATLMAATNSKVIYEGQMAPTTTAVFGLSEVHQIREVHEEIAEEPVPKKKPAKPTKTTKNVKFVEPDESSDDGAEISS